MRHIIHLDSKHSNSSSMIAIGDTLSMLPDLTLSQSIIIISDKNLLQHYPDIINRYPSIIIDTGEDNKTLATIEHIHRELLAMNADRHTFLVGFGGGIVTDITGFAASTFMRGTRFGFVATSLLAQVDASVGGKNGVNLDGYKNIIGTFNQPDFVLCDINILKTLPVREFRAGLSEALKCGIIGNVDLFNIFRTNSFEAIRSSPALLMKIITESIKIKVNIVQDDERETGLRKLLNLGHTYAHSIERNDKRYNHGEAVAIGISIIAHISRKYNGLSDKDYAEIIKSIENLGLPTHTDLVPTKEPKRPTGTSVIPLEKPGQPTNTNSIRFENSEPPIDTSAIPSEKPGQPTNTNSIRFENSEPPIGTSVIPLEKPGQPTNTNSIRFENSEPPIDTSTISLEKPGQPTTTNSIRFENSEPPIDTSAIPSEKPGQPTNTNSIRFENSEPPIDTSTIPSANLKLTTEINPTLFEKLTDDIKADKKRKNSTIDLILIDQIGRCSIQNFEMSELAKFNLDNE